MRTWERGHPARTFLRGRPVRMRARCPRSQGFSEVGPSPFLWVAAQAGFNGILGDVFDNRIVVFSVANEPVKSDCAIPYAVG